MENRYAGHCAECNTPVDARAGQATRTPAGWQVLCAEHAAARVAASTLSADGVVRMPFDRQALPILRSAPGARWDRRAKVWRWSVADTDLERTLQCADRLSLDVSPELLQRLDAEHTIQGLTEDDTPNTGAENMTPKDLEHVTVNNRFADLEMESDPTPIETASADLGNRFADLEIPGAERPAPVEPARDEATGPALLALRQAGYDFPVTLAKLGTVDGYPKSNIDQYRACLREDTGRVFGVVSPNYGYVQPRELAELIDAALGALPGADDTKVRCQGSTFGDRFWFRAKLPHGCFDISPELQAKANEQEWIHLDPRDPQGNIPIQAEVISHHALGGGASDRLSIMLTCLICANGLTRPLEGFENMSNIVLQHRSSFEHKVKALTNAFEKAQGAIHATIGDLTKMVGQKITGQQFLEYAMEMLPGETKAAENRREQFARDYQAAPGALPGTAWGALQAGTYWATHRAQVKIGGQSLRNYTLADPADVTEEQRLAYQGQARLESLVQGRSAAFTERAYQYVSNMMM